VETSLEQTRDQLQRQLDGVLSDAIEMVLAAERSEWQKPVPDPATLGRFRRIREHLVCRQVPDWVIRDPKARNLAKRLIEIEMEWIAVLEEAKAECLERRRFDAFDRLNAEIGRFRSSMTATRVLEEDVPAAPSRFARPATTVVPSTECMVNFGRFGHAPSGGRPPTRRADSPMVEVEATRNVTPPFLAGARIRDDPVTPLVAAAVLAGFVMLVLAVAHIQGKSFGNAFGCVTAGFGGAAALIPTAIWAVLAAAGDSAGPDDAIRVVTHDQDPDNNDMSGSRPAREPDDSTRPAQDG
jgi:hypothetical protein